MSVSSVLKLPSPTAGGTLLAALLASTMLAASAREAPRDSDDDDDVSLRSVNLAGGGGAPVMGDTSCFAALIEASEATVCG